jgi:drug/metabolite transporter (DMT)-like permease
MLDTNALGAIAALGSAASWAIGAFLFKALGEVLSPLAMTLSKGVCSLLLLGAAMLLLGVTPMDARALALLAASGVIGIAIGDTLFFRALQGLGAQPLLVLMVVGQVLTVGLAVLFLGESLTIAAAIGIAFVLSGVVIVIRSTTADEGQTTKLAGVIYGLLAVTCMAVGIVLAKVGIGPSGDGIKETFVRDSIQETFVRMLAGTLGVLGYGVATRQVTGWIKPFRDKRLVGRFVRAVAAITFGGFWLGMVALKHTTVAVASTLTSTEPAFGLLIGAVIFREKVRAQAVLGTALTFMGVVCLSVPEVGNWLTRWIH